MLAVVPAACCGRRARNRSSAYIRVSSFRGASAEGGHWVPAARIADQRFTHWDGCAGFGHTGQAGWRGRAGWPRQAQLAGWAGRAGWLGPMGWHRRSFDLRLVAFEPHCGANQPVPHAHVEHACPGPATHPGPLGDGGPRPSQPPAGHRDEAGTLGAGRPYASQKIAIRAATSTSRRAGSRSAGSAIGAQYRSVWMISTSRVPGRARSKSISAYGGGRPAPAGR